MSNDLPEWNEKVNPAPQAGPAAQGLRNRSTGRLLFQTTSRLLKDGLSFEVPHGHRRLGFLRFGSEGKLIRLGLFGQAQREIHAEEVSAPETSTASRKALVRAYQRG
jgi:hypothetical protein